MNNKVDATTMKPQNKRKLKPKLRFPEFRDVPEWKIKEVGQVTRKLLDGDWIESNDQSKNGVRLIQTGNIGIGEFISKNDSARYVSEDTFNRLNCTEVFPGDCLISRLPDPVGRSCLLPNIGQRMITAVDCAIARFDLKKIIPHIFVSYSQTHQYLDRVNSLSSGSTRKRISRENLSKIEIPLPEIPEQQKIADCLSSLDELIAAQTQKLDTLKDHKKGLLQQLFPAEGKTLPQLRFPEFQDTPEWDEKEVGEVFKVTRGNVLSMTLVQDTRTHEMPYPVYSSQTKNNGLSGFYSEYLYEDAITWTTDGANAGDVNYRQGKFYCTNVCGVLINTDDYANPCVAALINSVSKKHVSYVGNPKLMNGVMSKIKIPLPSVAEQQKIADCLSSLDEQIIAEIEKINVLQDHKKGLMQQLFPFLDEAHG